MKNPDQEINYCLLAIEQCNFGEGHQNDSLRKEMLRIAGSNALSTNQIERFWKIAEYYEPVRRKKRWWQFS